MIYAAEALVMRAKHDLMDSSRVRTFLYELEPTQPWAGYLTVKSVLWLCLGMTK